MSKTRLDICIYSKNSAFKSEKIESLKSLQKVLGKNVYTHIHPVEEGLTSLILVDSTTEGWESWVKDLDRSGKSVVLLTPDTETVPEAKSFQYIDDVLVYPFRTSEVMSMIRHHHFRLAQHLLLAEVKDAESDLKDANQILERIIQAKTPKRFNSIKGLQIMSRHLSGLKPGGDYFDVFESDRRDFVNFLLVDSSTYGISAALLGMILSSSAKIASDSSLSTFDWVSAIYQELKITLGEEGHFSVFFGRLNRKDFSLHYQLFGSVEVFRVNGEGTVEALKKQGAKISEKTPPPETSKEGVVSLNPKDRLVLLSDGFTHGVGGEQRLHEIFKGKLSKEPFALVNELSFQIKGKLNPGETFPGEDCSAIVVDVENRVLRLAPTG